MNPRFKTFIGSIILIAMMGLYALIAVTVASARLAESSGVVHLAFFCDHRPFVDIARDGAGVLDAERQAQAETLNGTARRP